MTLTLITELNNSVEDNESHSIFMQETTTQIDENASIDGSAWNDAPDSKQSFEFIDEAAASMDRHSEREWMQQAADETKRQDQVKNKKLGMKTAVDPKNGELVMIGDQLGQIVDMDAENKKVIIKAKSGQEKVFSFDQLLGPKVIKNKNTWLIKK